ncbi:TM2 domain-containing protein [Microbacterium sp. NPDC089987]|uniref:TM2 domain-containing protein n=1 Tax=Microbacterium sp. NPDC089987 TaxID=3364202 RepID=UPI00382FDD6B
MQQGQVPPPAGYPYRAPTGQKSYLTTAALSFFLGFVGADRFYLGKTGTALLKLLTFGGLGYWWFIDILITLCGGQRDAHGFRLAGYDHYKKRVWAAFGLFYGGIFGLAMLFGALTSTFGAGSAPYAGAAALTIVGAGGTAAILWYRRRRSSPKRLQSGDPVPPRLRASLTKIVELRPAYTAHAAAGKASAAEIARLIDSLQANTPELFARLAAKSDAAQRGRAENEYIDKFDKLATALGQSYLLDILSNPHLWEAPARHAQDVQRAVEAVDNQLLDNIRQVNAHHGLIFQVSIDGLIGRDKEMDNWQRDFDEASGAE